MIFEFALMPGDRFSESELAQSVAVSRTPLRQALQRLEREGFLRVMPKIGWQVAPLDFDVFDVFDVFDELYDLRVLIECHSARQLVPAAERLTDSAEVGRSTSGSTRNWWPPAANREMTRVHHEISERIRIIRRLDFTKPARVEATYDEHARILRAITRRRADDAVSLLKAHVEQSKLEVRHITLETLHRARQRG